MNIVEMTGRGLRGESFADVLRRTGDYDVDPGDSDSTALSKFNSGKAASSITITGGGLLAGQGGDLTGNRTFTITAASNVEAAAGSSTTKVLTPANLGHVLASYYTETEVDGAITTAVAGLVTAGELEAALDGYAPLSGTVPNSRTVTGGGLATGGGELDENLTITVTAASNTEARAGTATDKVLTPAAGMAVITDRAARTSHRPGDAIHLFTSSLTGDASAAAAVVGTIVNNASGAVLRVTGAQTVALRERFPVEAGHSLLTRFALRRSTNTSDPEGDAIELGVQWLTNAKAAISESIISADNRTVAEGRLLEEATFTDDDEAFEWPATACYAVPFIRTYGDGVTDIEVLAFQDVTFGGGGAGTPPANNYELWLAAGNTGTLEDYLNSQEAAANAQAVLAGHYANDSTDVDVPGGSAGERGAKYWSLLSGSSALALSTYLSTQGYGRALVNLFYPALATAGQYIDSTGALAADAAYTTSAPIAVSTALSYRLRQAASQLCFYDSLGAKIGTVASKAADTAFTPPALTVTLRFTTLNTNLTKPKQMLIPTGSSIASQPYISPFVQDVGTEKRASLRSAMDTIRAIGPQGLQLYDIATSADGFALNVANGNGSANASYSLSDHIPVDRTTTMIQTHNYLLGFYDENKAYLGSNSPGTSAFDPVAIYPDTCWIKAQILLTTQDVYGIAHGATAPTEFEFGLASKVYVASTVFTQSRGAMTTMFSEDLNVLDPSLVVLGRAISAANGATSANVSWNLSGRVKVNSGSFFSSTLSSNALVCYDRKGAVMSSPFTASQTFTGSVAGNIMTVTADPTYALLVGQNISGSGMTAAHIRRKLTSTTYLLSGGAQTVASTTLTASNALTNNRWYEVPTGCYFVQFQSVVANNLKAATVKQGRSNRVNACTFTATISGTVMTVSAVASGQLEVGMRVQGDGVTTALITSLGTGIGGTGTYNIDTTQTIAVGQTMYAGLSPTVTPKPFGGVTTAYPQNWTGLRLYVHGDSQTNNGLFQSRLATVTGMSVTSEGTPGRRMEGAATAIASVDLAAYAAVANFHGTNDFGSDIPIGAFGDDMADDTFYGHMDGWLDEVLTDYPGIRVIFVGIPQRTDSTVNGIGLGVRDYNAAMRDFCERWSITFCDLERKAGINSYTGSTYLSDGLHVNAAGGEVVGRLIGNTINVDA